MQPLQTEAAPRSACARCGEPLPRPNGSATYVYGVGAVGYQSCPACGAKWRYLWHDHPAPWIRRTGRSRLVAVVGGLLLAAAVVVVGVALVRSQRWSSGAAPKTTVPKATPSTRPPSTVPKRAAAAAYTKIADPMYADRKTFMTWLRTTASSTPQYQVNNVVSEYVAKAQAALHRLDALDRSRWPDGAAAAATTLVDADRAFLSDADLVQTTLLYSPSFIDKLNAEAVAVRDADSAVRVRLGLPPLT